MYEQRHKVISVWFALVSILYELKRDKQDFKVAESWRQSFNFATISRSKNINENEAEIWIEKGGFQTRIKLKIWLKNTRKFLGQSQTKLWLTARYAPYLKLTWWTSKQNFCKKTSKLDLKVQKQINPPSQ